MPSATIKAALFLIPATLMADDTANESKRKVMGSP